MADKEGLKERFSKMDRLEKVLQKGDLTEVLHDAAQVEHDIKSIEDAISRQKEIVDEETKKLEEEQKRLESLKKERKSADEIKDCCKMLDEIAHIEDSEASDMCPLKRRVIKMQRHSVSLLLRKLQKFGVIKLPI